MPDKGEPSYASQMPRVLVPVAVTAWLVWAAALAVGTATQVSAGLHIVVGGQAAIATVAAWRTRNWPTDAEWRTFSKGFESGLRSCPCREREVPRR